MTSVQLNLPDELALRVKKHSVLESAELLRLIEKVTAEIEQQQQSVASSPNKVVSILDKLSAPELQGLADIEFDIQKTNITLKEVDF